MSGGDQNLNTTPVTISTPHEDLCVTCAHHGFRHRPFMSGHEVHSAGFLTCKARGIRSLVNGVSSDWCSDIRADRLPCPEWKNDRGCGRCKWARFRFASAECHHPSFEKKFESGEYAGQAYWPSQRGHIWTDNFTRVDNEHVRCGADAPLWESLA